jgi:hypothetical protein
MGDGQHGWAAAEWIMMMRSCFVREEADRLIVGSGLLAEWFESDDELRFGPTLTPWGAVTVRIERPQTERTVHIEGHWREKTPRIDVAIPGFALREDMDAKTPVELKEQLQIVDIAPMTSQRAGPSSAP